MWKREKVKMNIFYEKQLSILTTETIKNHLTEQGVRLLQLICNNPNEVCKYIYDILVKDRQQWSNILCELQAMLKDGIIYFKSTDKVPSQYNLQIIFPIQINKDYERIFKK